MTGRGLSLLGACGFRYPHCRYWKPHTYGVKRKPTTIKNQQVNAILEHGACYNYQYMLHTTELDCILGHLLYTYLKVWKALSRADNFGWDMLIDNHYVVDWYEIGKHRHRHNQTDPNTACDNAKRADFDYAVCRQVLIQNNGILCKNQKAVMTDYMLPLRYIWTVQSNYWLSGYVEVGNVTKWCHKNKPQLWKL